MQCKIGVYTRAARFRTICEIYCGPFMELTTYFGSPMGKRFGNSQRKGYFSNFVWELKFSTCSDFVWFVLDFLDYKYVDKDKKLSFFQTKFLETSYYREKSKFSSKVSQMPNSFKHLTYIHNLPEKWRCTKMFIKIGTF